MRLENSFEVPASPERSWRLLNDVPSVVPCLPGAELVEVVDENAWKAKLHVRLGPIALQFLADVVREQSDEASGRVVLAARARESKGRGSAEATIESTLTAAGGGTRVDLVTELALRGVVAQYGRGVVGDLAARLTADFAACLRNKLVEPDSAAAAAACASRVIDRASASTQTSSVSLGMRLPCPFVASSAASAPAPFRFRNHRSCWRRMSRWASARPSGITRELHR
jgi:carbon monoxide dehydrogenase subunit G